MMPDRPDWSRPTPNRSEGQQALARILLTRDPGVARIRARTQGIRRSLLNDSPHIREPNFTAIHPGDLSFLFAAYDARFMDGICGKLLGPGVVTFRLSNRMTRAAGKTTRFRLPDGAIRYEIAVAASILFDGFAAGDPKVTVCGLPCVDRLDALQRLFEHELVHLAEWICWNESHCGRNRFQDIANRLFLHQAHTHQLITRSERAAGLGITIGAKVTFTHHGQRLEGRVNRVTKRATVLVEDPAGERWSDGRRYSRYYVPIAALSPVDRDQVSGVVP